MSGPVDLPRIAARALAEVRARRPRVHCLMNTVVQKFVADGISALDAIPSMTSAAEEVAAFVRKADALAVNLGTLDAARREAIGVALDAADEAGRKWLLDPAHCDYSAPRCAFAQQLLGRGPAVLRANAAEIVLLSPPEDVVAVETGAQDRIAGKGQVALIGNGHPLMAKVTGTGCLSGGVIAAFLAVEPDPWLAAAAGMLVVSIAAEIAGESARGPGTFEPAFLDALAALSPDEILTRAKVHHDRA